MQEKVNVFARLKMDGTMQFSDGVDCIMAYVEMGLKSAAPSKLPVLQSSLSLRESCHEQSLQNRLEQNQEMS